jgi:hypothetical protein
VGAIVKGAVVEVEKFHSSGNRILGALGIGIALAFGVVLASDGLQGRDGLIICLLGIAAVLVWTAMVRPQLRLSGDRLFIRDMLTRSSFSLAALDAVETRQVVVLKAGGRKFISAAVSKSLYAVLKDNRGVVRDPKAYPNFVENRIWSRAEDERAKLGAQRGDVPLDLHREPAWPELALLALFAVGAVVFLLV